MQKNTIEVMPPSWMSLYTEMMFDNTRLSTCTSFIVQWGEKFYLITNRHNLTGRDNNTDECLHPDAAIPNKIVVDFNKKGFLGQTIRGEMNLFNENNERMWLEHPEFGGKVDIGAIDISFDANGIEYYPYVLEDDFDIKIQPSDQLNVLGFPFGETQAAKLAIWSTGFMASDYGVDYNALPLFLIDCRARQGQSGSPVIVCRNSGVYIDMQGNTKIMRGSRYKLFGVYSGRINKESDLGYVWKTKAIEEVISQKKLDLS